MILDAAGDPGERRRSTRLRLADLLRGQGRPDDAVRLCREALALVDAHPGTVPPPLRFVALSWLASALREDGKLDEAEAAARALLAPSRPRRRPTARRGGWR